MRLEWNGSSSPGPPRGGTLAPTLAACPWRIPARVPRVRCPASAPDGSVSPVPGGMGHPAASTLSSWQTRTGRVTGDGRAVHCRPLCSASSSLRCWVGAQAEPAKSASTPSREEWRAISRLVQAPNQLRSQCAFAATRLGFAVPCPRLVPSMAGRALSCPRPVGAASALPPCVGVEGVTQYPVFFLDYHGFAVPKASSGIDGKPVGQMTLEAHRLADDPLRQPCIGGRSIGTVRIGMWTTSEFICPNDSPSIERVAVHGEGAYVGHLALAWTDHGISYIASADGHSRANLTLLTRFVHSTSLVSPGNSEAEG